MADALISLVLEQVGSIIVSEIEEEVKLVVDVKKELEKLKSNLLSIRGVLADAEERQLKEIGVKQWLDKLKAVSYDMDDVLDEWSTRLLKSQIEGDDHNGASKPSKSKVLSIFPSSCCFCFREVGFRREIAHKIKELNEILNDIKIQKDKFSFDVGKCINEQAERQITTSLIDITEVQSRKQEKDEIINLLLTESGQNSIFETVAIVGIGGMGKTTLAQLAFHDHEVKAFFTLLIWVSVSYPFDLLRIAKAILEFIAGDAVDAQNLGELETIVTHIKEVIRGKKFLLVLDDMWEDGPEKWKQLKNSLLGGLQGSKILVTTRSENVARKMGCTRNRLFQIGELSLEECWSIFSQVAFFDRNKEECLLLEDIGRGIVKKCGGLPLAARTLGSFLCLKDSVQEWREVLKSEVWEIQGIWEPKEPQSGLASLWLSYYDLPLELRQCFSYCAIFPKDHVIEKENLIELWMAQGYLGTTSTKKAMEAYGEEHFQNLARRCFFQDFVKDSYGVMMYTMHDIMHDFAKYLAKNECFSVEVNNSEELTEQPSWKEARYLRIALGNDASFPNSIFRLKNLRSLWVKSDDNEKIRSALPTLFDELSCLRSLILRECCISEIPPSISKLIHLRQLDLSGNRRLEKLPENLCDLCNLQTLDVNSCPHVELPARMEKLINLRHLHNFQTSPSLPKAVGRLSGLRSLNQFSIGSDSENVSSLADLKSLNQLQGHLCITRLENVDDVGDAKKAELKRKIHITSLVLEFGDRTEKCHDDELIECLEPSPDLEYLKIVGYQGVAFVPSWMLSLTSLRVLIFNSRRCEHFPPFWKLPSLEHLELINMKHIRRLGAEFFGVQNEMDNEIFSSSARIVAFPKLKDLFFYSMIRLEDWGSLTMNNLDKFTTMPYLRSLVFHCCPKLKTLPEHLIQITKLEELTIYGCPILSERYQQQQQERAENWPLPNLRLMSKYEHQEKIRAHQRVINAASLFRGAVATL